MVLNHIELMYGLKMFRLIFCLFRRRVVQVYARGARILDGAFMTQDLPISESSTVLSVSIADPYVLLRMSDGNIQLLVGGTMCSNHPFFSPFFFFFFCLLSI